MKRLKNILLYAGLDEEQFLSLTPNVWEINRKNLTLYSLIAVITFSVLFVATWVTRSVADVNRQLYGVMLLLNIAIYLCSLWVLPKTPALVQPLGFLFMVGLYAFSLAVTGLHPEYPAVSTIVLLFAIPFLLLYRPVSLVILTLLVMAGLCLFSHVFKEHELAVMDTWNTISFGLIAITAETLQQCNRFKMLHQEEKLVYLSNTDLLTGARNRNRFENQKNLYAQFCASCLSCIYVDVNGLHALNDKEGHLAGDRLLIAASHALIAEFGEDETYRIGGDEFVCFGPDTENEVVRQRMQKIDQILAKKGYSISWGAATQYKPEIDMRSLTTAAEEEMYDAKRRYYQQSGHDRRSR